MPKITRFEDLICWPRARELVNTVYEITKQVSVVRDYELVRQLRKAALSGKSNIAEGFCRYHKRDFVRFLDISQSSAGEVKSLLYTVEDQHDTDPSEVKRIQRLADECRQITLGLLRHVDQSIQNRGRVEEPPVAYGHRHDIENWNLPTGFVNSPSGSNA